MNIDFPAYIEELKKQIYNFDSSLTITDKKLQYGMQLTVEGCEGKVVLAVYNGKKGIKLVWGGRASELKQQLELALTGKSAEITDKKISRDFSDYTLLRNYADFKGIWAGSDESGKGDFFGPLVVGAVLIDKGTTAEKLVSLGVKDCKLINDKEVLRLADLIMKTVPIQTVLALKPEMYNYRYKQMLAQGKNLNHLLSNGHISVLRSVLRQCPECNYALVDQFTASNDIRSTLQKECPFVNVVQQHRAEADIAVAAASVLARAKFLEIMRYLAVQVGLKELPKGGGNNTTDCARELAQKFGRSALEKFVKMHFANYKKI